MGTLKRCVRNPNNPLAQVVCRLDEKSFLTKQVIEKKPKKGLMLNNGVI